jgi:hypothetical protein
MIEGKQEFIIKDGEYTTKIYTRQGMDLSIEQIGPDGKDVHLSHYSSPGASFFSVLVKFLHIHNVPIPKFHIGSQERNAEFANGRLAGTDIASKKFPLPYQYYYGNANLEVHLEEGENPKLIFKIPKSGDIVISIKAAKELIKKIPELYPYVYMSIFYHAHKEYLRHAKEFFHEQNKIRKIPKIHKR